MKINFEYVTALQYEVKALRARVEAYESGDAFRRQREKYEKMLREKDRTIKRLKKELGDSRRETVTVRNIWMEVFEDLEKEHQAELKKERTNTSFMTKCALKAESERDKWHDKWRDKQQELYAVQTELENQKELNQKELNQKLTAQVNRDFENSSIPSSMQAAGRKKSLTAAPKQAGNRAGSQGIKGTAGRNMFRQKRMGSRPLKSM